MPQITQYAVYLLPLAAIIFVLWWFLWYVKESGTLTDKYEWVKKGPKNPFDFGSRGKMNKGDILPCLAITAVYAIAAFLYLGNTKSPQSFWRATDENRTVLIDMGEAVVIDTVFYYTGNFHGADGQTYYQLEFSEDGENFTLQPEMQQKYSMTFQWHHATLNYPLTPTRYIRITANCVPLELGELCVIANDEGVRYMITDGMSLTVTPEAGAALFDEQSLVPQEREVLNGTYFDEIYHGRAAYELINNIYPYETTHPPLGKEIISVGVKLFGMTPFGWRFMGTLFGVLMLPLMYLLLKQLFDSTFISACGTIIWAADFMHFTQTRISTIDTYNVFFVLLMFIFMHRWVTLSNDTPFIKTLPSLFLCGLSFGLGAAAKWSSIYAGIGLVALYVFKLISSKRDAGFIISTLAASAAFFLVVPAALYMISYIPYVLSDGKDLSLATLWDTTWRSQTYMYSYHSRLVDTHPYAARWYHWIFDIRPICYYYKLNDTRTTVSTIMALTNPLLTWGGLVAMGLCAADIFTRKCFKALFTVIGYMSVFLPWVLVSRLTFPYHYFPASMFLVVALCHVFWRLNQKAPEKAKRHIIIFTAACAVLFVAFYPVISGLPVPYSYTKNFLQWFPSWPL